MKETAPTPTAQAEALAVINATPAILDLLYDLDLLPEQTMGTPAFRKTLIVVSALSSATQEDPRWIPVTDALPKMSSTVLIYAPSGYYQKKGLLVEADFVSGSFYHGFYSNKITGVTHWMPLPKAPEVKP